MTKPDIREYLTKESIAAYREYVIEECAKVAERHFAGGNIDGSYVAAAIRSLKDKSCPPSQS